jgi:hypothetical protein
MAISLSMRETVLFAWGHKCFYCGRAAQVVDHIIPLNKEGTDNASNLVAACNECNTAKSDLWLPKHVLEEALEAASRLAPFVIMAEERYRAARKDAEDRINYGSLPLRNGIPGQATVRRAERVTLPAREVAKTAAAIVQQGQPGNAGSSSHNELNTASSDELCVHMSASLQCT